MSRFGPKPLHCTQLCRPAKGFAGRCPVGLPPRQLIALPLGTEPLLSTGCEKKARLYFSSELWLGGHLPAKPFAGLHNFVQCSCFGSNLDIQPSNQHCQAQMADSLDLHELNCFHYCLLRAGCGNTSDWFFSLESLS